MLALVQKAVKKTTGFAHLGTSIHRSFILSNSDVLQGGAIVAEVKIEDGIIRIKELDVQDPKAAKALAEYPETRWSEITRRALKIGLGYLQGGAQD